MKPSSDLRRPALECVTTPGTLSGFRPRRMPSLQVACPANAGALQRYRNPLWRAFKADKG